MIDEDTKRKDADDQGAGPGIAGPSTSVSQHQARVCVTPARAAAADACLAPDSVQEEADMSGSVTVLLLERNPASIY